MQVSFTYLKIGNKTLHVIFKWEKLQYKILYSVSSQSYRKYKHQNRIKKNKPICYDVPLALKSESVGASYYLFYSVRDRPVCIIFTLKNRTKTRKEAKQYVIRLEVPEPVPLPPQASTALFRDRACR